MPSENITGSRTLAPGDLNPISRPGGLTFPENSRRSLRADQLIKHSLEGLIAKDAKPDLTIYPLKAVVLDCQVTACSSPTDKFSYARLSSGATLRIRVTARIPELHMHLQQPNRYGRMSNLSNADRVRINNHPTFCGLIGADSRVPKVGDIILVDFENRANKTDGVYIGLSEEGQLPSDSASPVFSGKRFFDMAQNRNNKPNEFKTKRERSLKGDFYQTPMTLEDYSKI
jgi:hypothetical protein